MDGTVLIMDYSSYERQKIRNILDKIGSFNIIEVGGINQFKLLKLDIDDLKLILLDPALPTENEGFEVLKKIRSSEKRDVPVIIVSRSDEHELKNEAQKYAVNDYIIKPYPVKRLEISIKSLVRIVKGFYYDTSKMDEIRMNFDDYVSREIKYSNDTRSPFSILFITMLQIKPGTGAEEPQAANNRTAVYAIAVQKAKESLRVTDRIFSNNERDIIVALPCTDHTGAKLVCEKIQTQLELEFEKIRIKENECIYPVCVTYPEDGDNFQLLMETVFKKVSGRETLEKIISIPPETRSYADRSYNKFRKWF